jgi:hypothetical protein
MAPAPPRRPRTGAAAYLPLVAGICAVVLAREVLESLAPALSSWLAFVIALVTGLVVYTVVERWLARRDGDR